MTHTQSLNLNYSRTMAESLAGDLRALCHPDSDVSVNVPMAGRTTLRVGGPADCFVSPANEEDLANVIRYCNQSGIPWMVLGRGSNLLVRDGGIPGVVIHPGKPFFQRIEKTGPVSLECGAGARLKAISNAARDFNISGLEFLEGIPGSLGGALRMNAGAMGGETFDFIESIRIMSAAGVIRELAKSDIAYQYRSCPMLADHIALSAQLTGAPGQRDLIVARMGESNRKRWDSQPTSPSAGCTFKNPDTIPAGKLIDSLGLKGRSVGGAAVSDVHGNFMVNTGGAKASDFLQLIDIIQKTAQEKRGISLRTEVQIVGVDA